MEIAYREYASKRKFGVELEVAPSEIVTKTYLADRLRKYEATHGYDREVVAEAGLQGWAYTVNNNFWHVKFDSTCGPLGNKKKDGGGWEIASYVGEGTDELISIAEAASFLAKDDENGNRVTVNNHCGLHFHAEVSDFNPSMMGFLLGQWVGIETILLQACPVRRRRNRHCKSLLAKLEKAIDQRLSRGGATLMHEALWLYLKPHNLTTHENPDKRMTLNLVGFSRLLRDKPTCLFGCCGEARNTIELRIPEGTLSHIDIIYWGILFLNFIDTCVSNCKNAGNVSNITPVHNLEDLFRVLGLSEDNKLLLLDEALWGTKVWMLTRIIQFASTKKLVKEAVEKLLFLTLL